MKKKARIAGFWYLLMGVTGGFGIMFVPLNILVPGDAAATTQNLINLHVLYRVSIVSYLFGQVCFIFLALSLHRLFKDVNPKQSKLMVTMVTAAVPIAFLNTFTLLAAQMFVNGADYMSMFQTSELHAFVLGSLNMYAQGILIVQIFWGLWLFPFGLLVIQSKFIPKILGILLLLGGFSYVTDSFTGLVFPQYREVLLPFLMVPLAIGEFAIIFWLLIKGVREVPPQSVSKTI